MLMPHCSTAVVIFAVATGQFEALVGFRVAPLRPACATAAEAQLWHRGSDSSPGKVRQTVKGVAGKELQGNTSIQRHYVTSRQHLLPAAH